MKHIRLALFVLAVVLIIVTFALCNRSVKEAEGQEISFPQSIGGGELMPLALGKPNLVRVNGNWNDAGDLPTDANVHSYTSGEEAWREYFMMAHASRIRQTGNIKKLIIGWPASKPDTVIVKFWRWKTGSQFNLVGATQNLSPDINTIDTTTIVLSPPVAVAIGDYYSIHVSTGGGGTGFPNEFLDSGASAGPPGNEKMKNGSKAGMYFARPEASGFPQGTYTWGNTGQGASTWLKGGYVPVEFYMKAPQVVMLGASIITGHNEHRSFWENVDYDSIGAGTTGSATFVRNDSSTTALDSMPAFYICGTQVLDVSTTWPYSLLKPVADASIQGNLGYSANYTGWTYQNMGRGSDTAASLKNTITRRMTNLHPRLAFIGVGSADVATDIGVAAHVADMEVIMDSLDAHNVIGVFRGIVPRTKWGGGLTIAQKVAKHMIQ
jgi:hypothetical protein